MTSLLRGVPRAALAPFRRSRALRAVRARLARGETAPHRLFSGIGDAEWHWLHAAARSRRPWLDAVLPGLPAAALQATYTGLSGRAALREGFQAYSLFKECYEATAGPLGDCPAVVDFGCGWGRVIRYFLRDLPAERIIGLDHSEEAVRACRETNRWCTFQLVQPEPPTPLPSASAGLIYLFSVFSHLPEDLHLTLLGEFHRLLVPGGVLVATTRRRDFLEFCGALRRRPDFERLPEWLRVSGRAFPDAEEARRRYDRGEFCYSSHGLSGRWSFWGEACIPAAYVRRVWSRWFEPIDYIDDPRRCTQSVIVVRKPAAP